MTLVGARVLVVEDEREVCQIMAALLRLEGAEVTTVSSGREALSIFPQQAFDLVLCDLGLPDIPGDTLIRALLHLSVKQRIVVITGATGAHVGRAREAGAEAVFAKPVDWERILGYLTSPRSPSPSPSSSAA